MSVPHARGENGLLWTRAGGAIDSPHGYQANGKTGSGRVGRPADPARRPILATFWCRTGLIAHECGRYACPLFFPEETGQPCPGNHEQAAKGGCTTTIATSIGARLRYQLDRESAAYKKVYSQRTATERINSQAVELGIERPKLRNGPAIANRNTLIYVLINLRALQRIRQEKARRQREALAGTPAV